MSEEQIKVIVIENGAGFIKAGFSGEDRPCFPPSSVEEQKKPVRQQVIPPVIQQKPQVRQPVIPLKKPKSDIETTDQKNLKLENMETVWRDTFYNLNIDPSTSNSLVLLTVPPLTTKDDKEIITEIMFDKFNVRDLYIATDAVLALLATGKTTGIVLHSTEGATHIVPIYEGHAILHAIKRFNICGRDLTDYLMKLLEKCYSFNSESDLDRSYVNDIKKKLCYVSNNYSDELYNSKSKDYEMPNGNVITIDVQQFKCPEALFLPSLLPTLPEPVGIHKVIYNSIIACDADIRKHLFGNIILSGENTVFPGFAERLQKELNILDTDQKYQMRIKVHENCEEKQENLAWIGGSDLSSLDSFNKLMITKADYDESGLTIVQKKCF